MWNAIAGFFKTPWGTIPAILVVVVFLFFGEDIIGVTPTRLVTTFAIAVSGIGAIVAIFGIPRLEQRIGLLGSAVKGLSSNIASIYGKMQNFVKIASDQFRAFEESDEFDEHHDDVRKPAGNSPIALTDRGRKTANDIGIHDTVSDLLPKVMKLLPKDPSLMDVQEVCFDYALKQLRADVDNAVKHKIDQRVYHENGNYKNTLMVYGILLRDAAFKKLALDG